MKVASPILTFTSDEAFGFKFGAELSENSIHLQDWPNYSAEYNETAVCAKVDTILSIRDKVNEQLEKIRQDKIIGKSLEAEVEIAVGADSEDASILREFADKLAEIFIVSSVKIVEGKFEDMAVQVRKAEGERCVRCWRVLKDLDEHGVCPRCNEAIASKK